MCPTRRFRLSLPAVVVAALALASCGSPPDREMQQAEGAIEAARAAGADQYARDELAAAQDLLKRSGEAVAQRDYRLALNYALDSREQAQNAARLAADGKAIARVEADRATSSLVAALAAIQSRLKNAEAGRVPARMLAGPKNTAADGDRRLQEARTAMERGDYAGVVSTATAALPLLAEAERQLAAAVPPPTRPRR
jgi:hypothetical protein